MTRAIGILVLCVVVAVIMSFVAPTQTFATTDYWWDSYGSTTATAYSASGGGPGVWNSTGTLWRVNTSAGKVATKGVISNWVDGNNAIFASTAGTVTLGQAINANGLIFRTNGYVIGSSTFTLTLSGNAWVDAESGVTATINNIIGGSVGLNMAAGISTGNTGNTALTNTGIIVLTAQNSFTGGVKVGAGTLELNFAGQAANTQNIIGSGNALTLSGGTLNMNGNSDATKYSQTFNGTALTAGTQSYVTVTNISGGSGGTLALGTISNNTSGQIDFKSSDVIITASNTNESDSGYGGANGASSILGWWATANTMNDFASNNGTNITHATYNTADFTSGNVNASSSNQTVAGGGTTINSLLFNTGATTVTGGQISIASGDILEGNLVGSGAVSIANNLTTTNPQGLYVNQTNTSANMTISGNVTGTTLNKLGAGTLILTGTSYGNGVQVTAGTLTNNSSNLIELANAIDCGTLGGSAGFQKTLAGTVTLNANQTIAGFQLGDGTTTPTVTGTGSITLSSGNFAVKSGTINNVLSGSGIGMVKDTTGVVTLGGASNYTGATAINNGTLIQGAANALPSGSDVTVNAGATFDLNGLTDTVKSFTLNGGTLTGEAANINFIPTNGYTLNSGVIQSGGHTWALSGGAMTKTTAGTVTMGTGTAPSYTGGMTISQGVIDAATAYIQNATGTITVGDASTGTGSLGAYLYAENNGVNGLITIANVSGTTVLGLSPTQNNNNSSSFNNAITVDKSFSITSPSGLTAGAGLGIAGGMSSGTPGLKTVTFAGYNNDTGWNQSNVGTGQHVPFTTNLLQSVISDGSGQIALYVNGGDVDASNSTSTYTGGTIVANGILSTQVAIAATGSSAFGTGAISLGSADTSSSTYVGFWVDCTTAGSNIHVARPITVNSNAAGVYFIGEGATNASATYDGAITLNNNVEFVKYMTAVASQTNLTINGGVVPVGGTRTVSFGGPQGNNNNAPNGIIITGGFNDCSTQSGILAVSLPATGAFVTASTVGNAGDVWMSGTNNYSGATSIALGTLGAGSTNAFSPNTTVTLTGGALQLSRQIFGGGTKVGYDQTIGGLSLQGGTVTDNGALTGSSVAPVLTSNSTYDIQSGTISAVLAGASGSVGLNKTSSGNASINSASTYSGATSISAGSLTLGVANALSSSTNVTVSGSGTLALGAFTDTVHGFSLQGGTLTGSAGNGLSSVTNFDIQSGLLTSGILAGSSGLTKSTSGTVTMSLANTYTGDTTITGGTLVVSGNVPLSANSPLGNSANNIILDAAGSGAPALLIGGANTISRGLTISSDPGTYVIGSVGVGANAATFSGAITLNNNLHISSPQGVGNSGSVHVNAISPGGSAPASMTVTLQDGQNIKLDGAITDTVSNTIGIDVNLPSNLYSAFITGSSNTYHGATVVDSGILAPSTGSLPSTTDVTVNANGILSMLGNTVTVKSFTLNGGSITTGSSGTMNLVSGNFDLKSGTVTSVLGGTGVGLLKETSGTVTISHAATYDGNTSITGGVLSDDGDLPGTTNLSITNGGTMDMRAADTVASLTLGNGSSSGYITNVLRLTASGYELRSGSSTAGFGGTLVTLNKTTAGTVTLSGAGAGNTNSFTGTVNVVAGELDIASALANANDCITGGTMNLLIVGAVPTSAKISVDGGGTLGVDGMGQTINSLLIGTGSITGSSTITVSNNITILDATTPIGPTLAGAAALVVNAPGSVTLDSHFAYTGSTTVQQGTVTVGGGHSLPSATLSILGGQLDLGGSTQTVTGVTVNGGNLLTGQLTNNNAAFNVQNGLISTILDGSVGLNKTTAGVVTLTAINTYAGNTNVSGGTLYLASTGALAGGTVNVTNGAQFTAEGTVGGPLVVSASSLTVDGTVNGSVSLDTGATLNGNGTINGALSLVGSTLSPGHSPGQIQMNGLTLDAASTYAVELGAGSYDCAIILTDFADLGGSKLQLTELAGFTYAPGLSFWIVDSDCGTSAVLNQFAQGGTITLGNGDVFDISYNVAGDPLSSGNDVLLSTPNGGSIPEPTTLLLLGTGLLGTVGWLRRRNMK